MQTLETQTPDKCKRWIKRQGGVSILCGLVTLAVRP
jgi:hypothetical protein